MVNHENTPPSQDNSPFGSAIRSDKSSKRKYLALGVLIVTLATVAGVLYTILERSSEPETASLDSNVVQEISPNVGIVEIREDGLWPQTIKVKAGQQVQFVNAHDTVHQLVADQDTLKEFDSVELLSKGESYTYVFDTPGTYGYYDPADGIKYSGTVEVN